MNNAEESTKISKDARFATLGRAIADEIRRGGSAAAQIEEVALLRIREQQSVDKITQFAALARQIGDAHRKRRDMTPLLHAIAALRRGEIGPTVPAVYNRADPALAQFVKA
jgi:hypothetical protein